MLHEWLHTLTEPAIAAVDLMALVVIAGASFYAFVRAAFLVLTGKGASSGHEYRVLWLTYARWLVAGLTFQLAADIIESSITPTWEAIAKLGAIAVIRTFLNYFLARDMEEMRERDHAAGEARAAQE